MRVVFDLDDTICRTENRDYANARPIELVVQKMRQLQRIPGTEIIIHTARGMASCNGDVQKADAKNRSIIEKWLADHDIKVDEIIFGKPFADVYIDDKAMHISEFSNGDIRVFKGFSGALVVRVGDIVVKQAENAREQAEWYKEAEQLSRWHRDYFAVPQIYSQSFDKLFMEYILGNESVYTMEAIDKALTVLDIFRQTPYNCANDIDEYVAYVRDKARGCEITDDALECELKSCYLLQEATFCHGDFSLLNMMLRGGKLVLIDPSPKKFMHSWLLDAAKLRASLRWLDKSLNNIDVPKYAIDYFDKHFHVEELRQIKIVEKTHYYRVLYYAIKLGNNAAKNNLIRYYNENE